MWQLDGNEREVYKNCKSLEFKSKFYLRTCNKKYFAFIELYLQQLSMSMYPYLEPAIVRANAKMSSRLINGDFLKIWLPG
jgi:hypothetical protein